MSTMKREPNARTASRIASIAQLSDACIALERDQQSGPERGTTTEVLKNRYSGDHCGVACRTDVRPINL